MQAWKDYQEKNKDRFLDELLELLRIPSVSARSEHKDDMKKCAEAVKQRLLDAGADKAEIYPTEGHPVVYGEKITDPAKPTVLVYGHYDVQPPDPLELWNSGPFDPVIKDGKIYARGSADDKGQFYMHVKALEMMVKTGSLPTNIKFCIEGEEEIGSPNLAKFVSSHKDLLKADVVLISGDTWPGNCPFHGDCIEGLASGPAIEARSGKPAGSLEFDSPVWETVVHALAQLNHLLVVTAAPQRLLIGGGVMSAQPHLFPRIRRAVLESLNGYLHIPQVLNDIDRFIAPPGLGTLAGPLGALAIAATIEL